MPVNERHAPCFTKSKIKTPHYASGHILTLYFSEVPLFNVDGEAYFESYTDAAHTGGWKHKEIIQELFTRMGTARLPAVQLLGTEIWETVDDADDVFIAYDGGDLSGIVGGSTTGFASAYWTYIFKAATREQMRLSFYDTKDVAPQTEAGVNPPETDDGSVEWFVLRSAVKFRTNDNLVPTIFGSVNTGYNRRLARSYGRELTP